MSGRMINWLDGEEIPVFLSFPDDVLLGVTFGDQIGKGTSGSVYQVKIDPSLQTKDISSYVKAGVNYAAKVVPADTDFEAEVKRHQEMSTIEIATKFVLAAVCPVTCTPIDVPYPFPKRIEKVGVLITELYAMNLRTAMQDWPDKVHVHVDVIEQWLFQARITMEQADYYYTDMSPANVLLNFTADGVKVRLTDFAPYDGDYEENWHDVLSFLRENKDSTVRSGHGKDLSPDWEDLARSIPELEKATPKIEELPLPESA